MVPLTNPLPLQMFLIVMSIPFIVLAALAEEHEQAAHVLRESEGRFRLVANTAPVMIWMSGTDSLRTYVNQTWVEFTGRPLEAELGNGWAEGIHNEDLERCLKTYSQAFDQRQSLAVEYRIRRSDGEYRWILDTGVPRFNSDRNFAGYIGSCLDITARRRAEEALASVGRRLIEAGVRCDDNVPTGILVDFREQREAFRRDFGIGQNVFDSGELGFRQEMRARQPIHQALIKQLLGANTWA